LENVPHFFANCKAGYHLFTGSHGTILTGKPGLSGEMALRIEMVFGVRMDTLMRMQSAYEIARTRKREKLIRVGRVLRAA
jgi:plasmid maintenance system antidote protein VapI